MHSLIGISKLIEILVKENHLNNEKSDEILNYIKTNRVNILENTISSYLKLSLDQDPAPKVLTYEERAKLTENKIAKTLFKLMAIKKSNLCVAIDENRAEKILEIADQVGQNVVMIKLHCDIIDDFSKDFIDKLKNLATEHQFVLFEDRKFADIGNTVKDQFTHGLYKISEWADIINCHVISGEGVIHSLKSAADLTKTGCLIVAELSSKGNLITSSYTNVAVKFAENNPEFVFGFISQSKITHDQKFIHLTPGVNLEDSNDKLDQSYTTPKQAIQKKGADIIIVGRGICRSKDPSKVAKIYQEEAYKAYEELIN